MDAKPARIKTENSKSFDKKKLNRFDKIECQKELDRLTRLSQTNSGYFRDVQEQFLLVKGI